MKLYSIKLFNSKVEKGKSVAMILGNPFMPDPRVLSEAKALVENGFRVTIYCWDREKRYPLFEKTYGINIKRVQIQSSYGIGNAQITRVVYFWWKVFREMLKADINIIHCHDFDTLPVGYFLSRLKRIPVIYDSHEVYVDEIAHRVNQWILKRIINFENFILGKIDILVTPGKRYQKKLVDRGGKNPVIVGSYKNIDEFHPPPKAVNSKKRELGIEEQLVVCYIGAYYPSRAIFPLIEAVHHDPEVFLITGGTGSDTLDVCRLVDQTPNAVFLGFVAPNDIPLYTALSDVVYYCLYPEYKNNHNSLPNKLFEAMAAGKAIIATKGIGEIAEIIEKEQCGILVDNPQENNITKAFEKLKNVGYLLSLQGNALNAAKRKYNWHSAKQDLLNIYRGIFEN